MLMRSIPEQLSPKCEQTLQCTPHAHYIWKQSCAFGIPPDAPATKTVGHTEVRPGPPDCGCSDQVLSVAPGRLPRFCGFGPSCTRDWATLPTDHHAKAPLLFPKRQYGGKCWRSKTPLALCYVFFPHISGAEHPSNSAILGKLLCGQVSLCHRYCSSHWHPSHADAGMLRFHPPPPPCGATPLSEQQ